MSQLGASGPSRSSPARFSPRPPRSRRTAGPTRTKYVPPIYPEDPDKKDIQGNVLLIGRIDTEGNVVGSPSSSPRRGKEFVAPGDRRRAARGSSRRPCATASRSRSRSTSGVRFRMTGGGRGLIPRADPGRPRRLSRRRLGGEDRARTAFPLRKGKDPALRAEALLDVPPSEQPRTMTVKVEAVSPSRPEGPALPAAGRDPGSRDRGDLPGRRADRDRTGRTESGSSASPSTEASAGGGQFWLAKDPLTFPFALPRP